MYREVSLETYPNVIQIEIYDMNNTGSINSSNIFRYKFKHLIFNISILDYSVIL